jgi:hypothetical protein
MQGPFRRGRGKMASPNSALTMFPSPATLPIGGNKKQAAKKLLNTVPSPNSGHEPSVTISSN